MKIVINDFSYFKSSEIGTQISYTYNILNDNGELVRNRIRKSTNISNNNKEILDAIKVIENYLQKEENKSYNIK